MDRGEAIKKMQSHNKPVSPKPQRRTPDVGVNSITSGMGSINLNPPGGGPRGGVPGSNNQGRRAALTKEEMEVLK